MISGSKPIEISLLKLEERPPKKKEKKKELDMYFHLLFELRFNTLLAVRLILLLRYHNSINDAKNHIK